MNLFGELPVLDWVPEVWKLVIRLLLAGFAGFLLGLERGKRAKDAGVRTQTILCLTSALLMIISKYGFGELFDQGIQYDPARIASNIITGLTFLGAGMILYKRESFKSLTTAAGLCANVAIGMAFGGGMIVLGVIATIAILFVQLLLHNKAFSSKKVIEVHAKFEVKAGYIEEFKQRYKVEHFVHFRTAREKECMIADVTFYCYNKISSEELFDSMSQDKNIISFEKVEE
ncbi:MAG: MgtC/SapB family protein [Clostridiales bacterium]|nr:MgtC/SapB family protein [Clostridiales bacterium]